MFVNSLLFHPPQSTVTIVNRQTYTKGRAHHTRPDRRPDFGEFHSQFFRENGYYR